MTTHQRRATHIGIEATKLLRERRGIGRYVRNVMLRMLYARPELRYTLFVRRAADIEPLREQLATMSEKMHAAASVQTVSTLPSCHLDVVWYPWNWLHPSTDRAACVVTVLDLAPMLQLDHRWWKFYKRAKYRSRYASTVRNAHMTIAISVFTKQEMIRYLRADPSRIRVTLLAADDIPHAPDGPCAPLDRLALDTPFFLTVGAQEARKNLSTLYSAMALLRERGERVALVQCGPSARAKDTSWLHHVGYVSDSELSQLYQRATALVFPSRYEGFGLPALEAMRAGGRVICANASSLPEVVGDAALTFEWSDAGALATQLQRMLHDASLRESLTRAGAAQADKFRWATTAAETLDAFDSAMDVRSAHTR